MEEKGLIAMAHRDAAQQSSLRVAGTIMDQQAEFLVDSGAVVSIMSLRCTKQLKIQPLSEPEPKLMGASGANLVVIGRTPTVSIQEGHLKLNVSFLIVESLVASLILGSDILSNIYPNLFTIYNDVISII